MTTNNHPAHAPLTSRRLHQMRDILSKAAAQRDGGDIGYAMSDAVKLIDEVLAGAGQKPVATVNHDDKGYHALLSCELPEGTPLYTATSAPVVPTFDEWLEIRGNKPLGWVKDVMRESYDACRAAMLQGKPEPVSDPYKLPATLIKTMQSAIDQLDRLAGKVERGYPQHGHSVSGVWDQSNGRIANEPCSVCALWDEMRGYLTAAPQQEVDRG